jgi:subtilase family serine protease
MGNRWSGRVRSGVDSGRSRRAGRPLRVACCGLMPLALLPTVLVGLPAVAGATATPDHVRLGRAPRIPRDAAAGSALPSAAPLDVDVILQPRDPAALAAYATAVSTPGSASYRQVLSEPQFVHRFGPLPDAVASVTRALTDSGLHPGPVSANDLSIPVRATAGQLTAAFSTGFKRYRLHGGRVAYANTAAPQVVGSIAPYVQGLVGLDDLTLAVPVSRPAAAVRSHGAAAPHVATGGPQPCSTAVHDGVSDSSYTTDQVAAAYGVPHLYGQGDLGSGQTVALYELQGYGVADIATYQSCYGTSTTVTPVDVDGGPTARSGVGEADVDIEEVLGLAPQVHIQVYQGPNSSSGGYDTYSSIVSADTAQVVSTSWGLCEPFEGSAAAQAESTLFQEAAVQGQSVLAASGDEGSEDCLSKGYADDTLAVDDPASQPFVTGVGGTSWSAPGPPRVESAWNDGPTCCWGSGGGGISTLWTMPAYQVQAGSLGVVNPRSSGTPCAASSGSYCREVPDVSALAGPFPYLNYVGGSWGSWGGTSLAAPLWASIIALTNASASCGGQDVGFANPALYAAAASAPAAFNDVTTGDNDLTGMNGGAFPAGAGYDMATGLGTPNGAVLPAALCAGLTPSPVSVQNPGNQTGDLGAPVALQVEASDATAHQTLTYGSFGLPPGLSIAPKSGLITGRPTASGTFSAVVTAEDGNGATGSTSFSWSIELAITSAARATAVAGQPFSFTITATGVPTSIKLSGKPPKGIKFHPAGNGTASLAGTAKAKDAPGTYPLVITATFGKGKTAQVVTQPFTLTLS